VDPLEAFQEEMLALSKERGVDRKIKETRGMEMEHYLDALMNREHINGKLLKEYRLEEFARLPDVKS